MNETKLQVIAIQAQPETIETIMNVLKNIDSDATCEDITGEYLILAMNQLMRDYKNDQC
jgi:hypothetical protein